MKFVCNLLYTVYTLCPHPPHFAQSHPHCRDFPLFFSRIIFLTANPTITARTAAVIAVPIANLLVYNSCHYFTLTVLPS